MQTTHKLRSQWNDVVYMVFNTCNARTFYSIFVNCSYCRFISPFRQTLNLGKFASFRVGRTFIRVLGVPFFGLSIPEASVGSAKCSLIFADALLIYLSIPLGVFAALGQNLFSMHRFVSLRCLIIAQYTISISRISFCTVPLLAWATIINSWHTRKYMPDRQSLAC